MRTPAEALAQVRALSQFLPADDWLEMWRLTIAQLSAWALQKQRELDCQAHASSRRRTGQTINPNVSAEGQERTVHSRKHDQPRKGCCRNPAVRQTDPRRAGSPGAVSVASSGHRGSQDQRTRLDDRRHEDAQTTIVRQQETHQRSNARVPPVDAAREGILAGESDYNTVCLAFTQDLRRVKWPKKFRIDGPPPYDGKNDPHEFICMYSTTVEITGGDDKAKDKYFPMNLRDNVH